MNAPKQEALIQIATLKKPYGIKGWLWVFSHTEVRPAIFEMGDWYMKTATGFKPLTVLEWRPQGSGLVASFKEIPNRTIAETMNGTSVWSLKDALPALAEDEYYWSQLIGLSVVNSQDECLGVVKSLFETGANDVLVVSPSADSVDGEERLIPWHKHTVLTVDLNNKTILVAWEKDY